MRANWSEGAKELGELREERRESDVAGQLRAAGSQPSWERKGRNIRILPSEPTRVRCGLKWAPPTGTGRSAVLLSSGRRRSARRPFAIAFT